MLSMSSQDARDARPDEPASVKLDVTGSSLPPSIAPQSPGTYSLPTGPGGDSQEDFASVPEFVPWKYESKAGAAWMASHLSDSRGDDIPAFRLKKFEDEMRKAIERRCSKVWFRAEPQRGSGLRCVINSEEQRCDPILLEAARAAGIRGIESRLPRCVLWVDPGQVRYRMDRGGNYTMSVDIDIE